MDDESGKSIEPMEQVPLIQLGEAELERLVPCGQRGFHACSWLCMRALIDLPRTKQNSRRDVA